MLHLIKKFFDSNQKDINSLTIIVEQINQLESKYQAFKDDQFAPEIEKIKGKTKTRNSLDEVMPDVLLLLVKHHSAPWAYVLMMFSSYLPLLFIKGKLQNRKLVKVKLFLPPQP